MRNEENESDFDREEEKPLSPEEVRRLRIHAKYCRRELLRGIPANSEFQIVVSRLTDADVIELYFGRHEQWALSASRTAQTEELMLDGIVNLCLQQHEKETEPSLPVRNSTSTKTEITDPNLREVHRVASNFLRGLLKERQGSVSC